MKSSQVFIILVFLMSMTTLTGQVPEGFNYQAVARDAQGIALENSSIDITLKIKSGNETGTLLWQELHNLTTNAIGSFSLVVGGSPAARTGGSKTNFSDIDWSADIHFLQITINGNEMGSSQLVSVPYAMHSATVDMPLENLEVIESPGTPPEDALFEVKREDGSIVFAVYNEGVRMYVDDTDKKGVKGGFAVGGYNASSKGYTNEYLRVTPDSVRIWINEIPEEKGIKGGFAVGGYNQRSKSSAISFMELTPENYFIGHEAGLNNKNGKFNSFFGYQAGHKNIDGNQNIFIGYKSGFSNTNGIINSFIGNHAGFTNTTGHSNVFIGDSSGYFNTTGYWNVFLGEGTGRDNLTGRSNVFVGDKAGRNNTIGERNVFLGSIAGWNNIDGGFNVFIGSSTGSRNISGTDNTFIGSYAGKFNTVGNTNIFIGKVAGYKNTKGSDNIYIGAAAGYENDSTHSNIFIGNNSGEKNLKGYGNVHLGNRTGADIIDGNNNTIIGHEGAHYKNTGYGNTFLGAYAGHINNEGDRNVFLGSYVAHNLSSGYDNTIIGEAAGYNMAGSGNIFIGKSAGFNEKGSGKLIIENSDVLSSTALIYGDFYNDKITFNGKVGINSVDPWNELHISSRSTYAKILVGEFDSIVGYSEFAGSGPGYSAGGSIRLGTASDFDDTHDFWQVSVWNEDFQIGNMTNYAILSINKEGEILHSGVDIHADYVFDDSYQLESIEDHAKFMWNNSHLPAVPKAKLNERGLEVVNLGERNKGVLEELEKAHIYIEQLNTALKSQATMIEELRNEINALKKVE